MSISRRDLIIAPTVIPLSVALASLGGTEPDLRYPIPNDVRQVRIKEIENALASGVPVGSGNYIPVFIDLVQYIHYALTGMGYAEHRRAYVKKQFGKDDQRPFEVVIEKDLMRKEGYDSIFEHGTEPGNKNRAFIDASLGPAKFLISLDRLLVYGVYGPGHFRADAHTHRDIAYMTASFPQLLRENDSETPLILLIEKYIGRVVRRNEENILGVNTRTLPYLALLSPQEGFGAPKDSTLEEAVEFAIEKGRTLDNEFSEKMLDFLEKKGVEHIRRILQSFVAKTEAYILEKNIRMPEGARALLKRKMREIRSKLDPPRHKTF